MVCSLGPALLHLLPSLPVGLSVHHTVLLQPEVYVSIYVSHVLNVLDNKLLLYSSNLSTVTMFVSTSLVIRTSQFNVCVT